MYYFHYKKIIKITLLLIITVAFSDYQWTDELVPVYVEEFYQPVGVKVPVPNTVRGVFELIFDQPLVEHIVRETNRYAKTVMGESKYEKWETIEVRDMYDYFGVMIMMGLVELPSLHDYGKRDSVQLSCNSRENDKGQVLRNTQVPSLRQ